MFMGLYLVLIQRLKSLSNIHTAILCFFLSIPAIFASQPDLIDQEKLSSSEKNIEARVEKILSSLSLEKKVGQMLIYGFKGQEDEDVLSDIKKYKLGGIILYSHNISSAEQVFSMNRFIHKASMEQTGIPAFISIDQEGGKVLRTQDFATVLPGNMNLGATGSSTLSFLAGKLTAVDLETLGINMNFAPVLDVNTSSANDVIGVRSFGGDPDMVAKLGSAYIRGIQSRRVSATAKHFPGHGNTSGDSHYQAIVLERSLDELRKNDFKPFVAAINSDVDAIMTAHISVPSIDSDNIPATMSKRVITDILRKELGFNGLVVTDDMEMRPVTKKWSIGRSAVQAVIAGCDLIVVAWSPSAKNDVYNSIIDAVKSNSISESRIDESLRRILRVKLKRDLFSGLSGNDPMLVKNVVGNKFHRQVSSIIAQKSITLLNNSNVIPVNSKKRVVLLTPFSSLSTELSRSGVKNQILRIGVKLSVSDIKRISKTALGYEDQADAFIVAVMDNTHAQLVNIIKASTKLPVIVAALDSPYIYSELKDVDAFLCSYSFRANALSALAKVISGNSRPKGRLPVYILDKYTYAKSDAMEKKILYHPQEHPLLRLEGSGKERRF
jgi:beta-N-acetylhexosaminidase